MSQDPNDVSLQPFLVPSQSDDAHDARPESAMIPDGVALDPTFSVANATPEETGYRLQRLQRLLSGETAQALREQTADDVNG